MRLGGSGAGIAGFCLVLISSHQGCPDRAGLSTTALTEQHAQVASAPALLSRALCSLHCAPSNSAGQSSSPAGSAV